MLINLDKISPSLVKAPRNGAGEMNCFSYLKNEDLTNSLTGFNLMELLPGGEIGFHQHVNDEEIYYILSGTGIVKDNDEEKAVKAGDLIYTKDKESHGLKNTGNELLKFLAFIVKI